MHKKLVYPHYFHVLRVRKHFFFGGGGGVSSVRGLSGKLSRESRTSQSRDTAFDTTSYVHFTYFLSK